MVRLTRSWAAFAVALLVAFSASSARADGCIGPFRFSGASTFLNGTTRRDQPCTIGYGALSEITGYRVVQRPRNGTLGSAGRNGKWFLTAYKPDAGYVGSDQFAVRIRYAPRSTQVESTTVVHVQMTVGP
jgi:hypothetical protein